jgi:hypothetical protein
MKRIVMTALCLTLSSQAISAPKPDPRNPQYMLGYSAGRRDERMDLCQRFERHSALAQTLLGQARMMLIRTFCRRKI